MGKDLKKKKKPVGKVVEPGGIEPPTGPCEGPVIPLNYGPTGR